MRKSLLPANKKRKKTEPEPKRAPETPSSQPAPRRTPGRWFQRLSLMTGILVVVGASLLVAWALRRYLRSSPRFAVRVVHVDGNARRSTHQLSQRAGIVEGKNIFEIEESVAKADLEADPWVSSATVTTDLPHTVYIKVVEREARALASIDHTLYLVDLNGEIFKELEEGDPHDLPVVTGIEPDGVARDRQAVTIRVRRALDLVSDLDKAGIAKRYPIQEIHIHPDTSLTLTMGSDGLALAFGTPPYRNKIAKADRILGELRHRQVKPAVIFLDNDAHPERVVVRMK
jgi:cell division protein FtsQ